MKEDDKNFENPGTESTVLNGVNQALCERELMKDSRALSDKYVDGNLLWNSNCHADVVLNGNLERRQKEDTERDLNMNKNNDDEKVIKKLAEEMEKLCCDGGKNGRNKMAEPYSPGLDKYENNREKSSCNSDESASLAMKYESAGKSMPEDDIISCMAQLGLDSKIVIKTDDKVEARDMNAAKCRVNAEPSNSKPKIKSNMSGHSASDNNPEEETIEIETQPQRVGEENEDLESPCLLSDAGHTVNKLPEICQSLLGRSPFGGVAKHNETQDVNALLTMKAIDHHWDDKQPKKYMRPNESKNLRMSGGCVQVVQPAILPTSYADTGHRSDFSLHHAQIEQQNCMWPNFNVSNASAADFHLWSNLCVRNGQPALGTSQNLPPPYYDEFLHVNCDDPLDRYMQLIDGDFSCSKDLPDGFEGVFPEMWNELDYSHQTVGEQALGSNLYHVHNQSYIMQTMHPQQSMFSPGNQQLLTSPGSSPNTYVESPHNSPSAFTNPDTDATDLPAFSPGELSLCSPESGFVTDDASLDLELAMEFIKEDTGVLSGRVNLESISLIPELVAKSSTDCDAIGGAMPATAGSPPKHKKKSEAAEPKKPNNQTKKKKVPTATLR